MPTVTELVRKLSAFCGTRRFFTVSTVTRYWSLSWARWIHSTHFHLISQRFILSWPY